MEKTNYNIKCNEKQLDLVIKALETANNFYNDYLYDVFDDFEELENLIKRLKELKNEI